MPAEILPRPDAALQPPPGDVLLRRDAIEAPLDPALYTTLRRMATSDDHRLLINLGGGSIPGLCGIAALMRIVEELELRPHVAEATGAGLTVTSRLPRNARHSGRSCAGTSGTTASPGTRRRSAVSRTR